MFLYETFVISQKTIYMRHIHLLLAGFLLCICCTLQAKNRVIDQPPFIVRNTTSIEVSKVGTVVKFRHYESIGRLSR